MFNRDRPEINSTHLFRDFTRRKKMILFGISIFPRALRKWIGKDVGFAILPAVIVLALVLFFKKDILLFWLAPEWSFAAVIMLGASIDRLSELREDRTLWPYKLDFLSKILIVLLILAVLTFALASSVDKLGKAIVFNTKFLVICQVALLALAMFFSYMIEVLSLFSQEESDYLPEWISPYRFYKHLRERLTRARRDLRYVAFAMESRRECELIAHDPLMQSRVWAEAKKEEIESELRCIESLFEKLRKELADLQPSTNA